ncbi:MAG: two-component regulator propeller domain-containing protein, partial [Bacteroidota bacterium]
QYNFKKYSTKNGLSNTNVKYLLQSKNGFIWMATQAGGLSRFDGREFKTFDRKFGLINSDISCLEEDASGNIWAGTVQGLCKFDGVKFTNNIDGGLIGKNIIYSIYRDSRGAMWVSTETKGLFIFYQDKIIKIDTSNGLSKNKVFAVLEENENSFWVSTHRGGVFNLNKDGKIISHIDSIEGAPRASIFCFYKSKDNVIFAGTNNSGLFKLSNKKFIRIPLGEADNDFIGSIGIDKKNNIWVCSMLNGLIKIEAENIKYFKEEDGLSSNTVNSLIFDYEGNLWVATQTGGVCLLKNDAVYSYTHNQGLSKNKLLFNFKLTDGTLLTSTENNGLFYLPFGEKTFKKVELSSDLKICSVTSILELKKDKIVCGTNGNGIFILEKNNSQFKLIKQVTTLSGQQISSPVLNICKDKLGNFWTCSFGEGLAYFSENGDLITRFTTQNGLSTNDLISLHYTKDKKLYVGQFNKEIYIVDDQLRIKPLAKSTPAELTTTWAINSDAYGTLFFGTQEGGLIIFDKGKFKQYDTKDGLCSNFIQSIEFGTEGEVWIGSDKGVNKLMLDKNYNLINCRYYSTDEGLTSLEIVPNGIFKDRDRCVWICSTEGLTRFDLVNDEPNITPPKLILLDIKLHYETTNWNLYSNKVDPSTNIPTDLVLNYHNNHMTFDFRALTVDHVKYRFFLENLDESWSPLTSNNQATYSNIPPGKYIFHVKGVNSFGVESKDEIVFNFEITPPFWKTWWFYVSCVVLITTSIVVFFKWRTAKLEREKKILEGKVNERTLELKGANENLSVALHDIKDSINYAERIQRAMLPDELKINDYLPDSFILFKPRDIVSGDFYWFVHKNDIVYVAAVDCTGHGVPGAFMSLVGSSLLNEIVQTKGVSNPSLILAQLNSGVQNSLRQRENNTRDGMDLALCAIDYKNRKLTYAGANRSLWIVRKDSAKLQEIKATKNAIGGFTEEDQEFKSHSLTFDKGDTIYLHSDGFADQFGGIDGKKLMTKRFKEILLSVQNQSMKNQRDSLNYEITNWMGGKYEQVDDILVIGIRF